jgi:hypothetical protein
MAITVRKYVSVERNCIEANGRKHALSAIDYAADTNAAVLLYYRHFVINQKGGSLKNENRY